MTLTATPTLTVAGAPVAGSLAGAPPLVAVDELRVSWGRSSVLEAPQPATATLTVLDRAPGAPFARRTDLVGQPLTLGWSAPGGGGSSFAGRITDVTVTPLPGAVAGGGFRVALAASSLEVDLANYPQPAGTVWPAESLGARRTRLLALIPATVAGSLLLPDRFSLGLQYATTPDTDLDTLQTGQLDVSGKTVLELLHLLYGSWSPLPAVYDPAGRFTYAGRRRFGYSPAGLTMSAKLLPDPDRAGRYVAAGLTGLHLDGHLTEYAGSLTQQIDSRITRVEVSWLNGTTTATAVAPTSNTGSEASLGRRVLSVDSMLGTAAGAQQLANLYADLASVEARTPRLGSLGWSSAREPLHSLAHATLLLSGWEQGAAVFVGRSWLPQLAQSPLVGLIGGSITYRDGGWSVDATPGPTHLDPTPFGWAPLTIRACAKPTVRLADVDPSVTFGDLGFLDVGAGFDETTMLPYKGNPLT